MGHAQLSEVKSGLYKWSELETKKGNLRTGRKIMEGSSSHFKYLEIHATTQEHGAIPSPPHTQKDREEIIIIKEGLMKMTLNGKSKILGAGSVIMIPPLVEQSMENVGDGPMTYYVMIYQSKNDLNLDENTMANLDMLTNFKDLKFQQTEKGGRINYFDKSTALCEKLEIHVTQLNKKGPSHAPHTHIDSEIILVIEGETEMNINGEKHKGTAGDLYLIKSNEFHGISNASDIACRYFAFRWIGR